MEAPRTGLNGGEEKKKIARTGIGIKSKRGAGDPRARSDGKRQNCDRSHAKHGGNSMGKGGEKKKDEGNRCG